MMAVRVAAQHRRQIGDRYLRGVLGKYLGSVIWMFGHVMRSFADGEG